MNGCFRRVNGQSTSTGGGTVPPGWFVNTANPVGAANGCPAIRASGLGAATFVTANFIAPEDGTFDVSFWFLATAAVSVTFDLYVNLIAVQSVNHMTVNGAWIEYYFAGHSFLRGHNVQLRRPVGMTTTYNGYIWIRPS